MFVDDGVVRVRAGRGGNGCMSFHRAKFTPRGGPDGGDGGRGGSIILVGDRRLTSLYDVTVKPNYAAESGTNGGSNKKSGRAAGDLKIRVPVGTIISEITPEGVMIPMVDILEEGQEALVARGGRGGGGNLRFQSARHRLPHFALRGAPGESRKLNLSLKLLSDIAIVGLPNSGKSTLLSALTAARPKIADYPFTTLTPNLGVLRGRDLSIVLADIPGLIKGAHEGRGLGNRFLKHIDRTAALIILLDATADAVADFRLLRDEISRFNPEIWDRPRIVAVNKLDLVKKRPAKKIGEAVLGISAKTGLGIEKLMKKIETLSARLEAPRPSCQVLDLDRGELDVRQTGPGRFKVVSRELEELASMLPDNPEALQWFTAKLRTDGILRLIGQAGAKAADVVQIGALEMAYEE